MMDAPKRRSDLNDDPLIENIAHAFVEVWKRSEKVFYLGSDTRFGSVEAEDIRAWSTIHDFMKHEAFPKHILQKYKPEETAETTTPTNTVQGVTEEQKARNMVVGLCRGEFLRRYGTSSHSYQKWNDISSWLWK